MSSKVHPLVSVIIPCFNAGRWIEETIVSVRSQTWRPIEIVCVDDGSTDDTAARLERLRGDDMTIVRQANRGQTAALNAGLARARGAFVQFLDADDLLGPEKISAQMARLLDNPGAISASAWARFRERSDEAQFVPEPSWRDADPIAWLALAWHDGGGMLFPARWLAPRAVLDRAGPWDETLTVHNDGEYFTRVLLQATRVLHVDAARAYYRSGISGSLSGRRDETGLRSYHRSLVLMQQHLASHLGDADLSRGLSFVWQRFARGALPCAPRLANDAMARARHLHPARLPVEGGWRFRALAAVAGWRVARWAQRWAGRA